MKPKLILCLALALSGGFTGLSQTSGTDAHGAGALMHLEDVKIVSPAGLDLPGYGTAIFREQVSSFTVQVPVGSRENGKPPATNGPAVQVWLLKTDGTSVPQSDKPSSIIIGSIGNYATDYAFFEFPKIPAKESAGFTISLNGKLYSREFKTGIFAEIERTREATATEKYFKQLLANVGTNQMCCVWFLQDNPGVGMVMSIDLATHEVKTRRDVYNWAVQGGEDLKLSDEQARTLKKITGELPPSDGKEAFNRSVSISMRRADKVEVFQYARRDAPAVVQRIYDLAGGCFYDGNGK